MQTNFRNIIVCSALVMLLPGIFKTIHSQTVIVNDSPFVKGTTVVIPGKEYTRSGYHNFFWGYHYRNVWATPVRVKKFFLDTEKGGLTPVKEGGGRQSKSLRLKDPAGKEYVLRSVNKDFGRGLKDMEGTFISRIAKDQVSIGHPFSAVTITPMSKAIGIYHTLPEIVFVPRQPSLKEYSDEYGDQLYLIERRPDENQEDAVNFGNSKNIVGSEKLFEKILEYRNPKFGIHQREGVSVADVLLKPAQIDSGGLVSKTVVCGQCNVFIEFWEYPVVYAA